MEATLLSDLITCLSIQGLVGNKAVMGGGHATIGPDNMPICSGLSWQYVDAYRRTPLY